MPDLTVAQNMFIGREPRSADLPLRAAAERARPGRCSTGSHLPLDPTELVGDLTVARAADGGDRARRSPTTRKLLIMDEPTAALNDAEVEVLLDLIRRFATPDTGVDLHLAPDARARRISDRITVIRDGRYVDTLDTADDADDGGDLADGRARAHRHGRAASACAPTGEVVLDGLPGCRTKALLDDVELRAAQGRDPRVRRADGRGPHGGGARDRRRRQDHGAARSACAGARCASPTRPTRPGPASATCRRTASSFGAAARAGRRANIVPQR